MSDETHNIPPASADPTQEIAGDTLMEGSNRNAELAIMEARNIIASLQQPTDLLSVINMLPPPLNTPDLQREVANYVMADFATQIDRLNDEDFKEALQKAEALEREVQQSEEATGTTAANLAEQLEAERLSQNLMGIQSMPDDVLFSIQLMNPELMSAYLAGEQAKQSGMLEAAMEAVVTAEIALTEPSNLMSVIETAIPDNPELQAAVGAHLVANDAVQQAIRQIAQHPEMEPDPAMLQQVYVNVFSGFQQLPPEQQVEALTSFPVGPQPETAITPETQTVPTEVTSPPIEIPSVSGQPETTETKQATAEKKGSGIKGTIGATATAATAAAVTTGAVVYNNLSEDEKKLATATLKETKKNIKEFAQTKIDQMVRNSTLTRNAEHAIHEFSKTAHGMMDKTGISKVFSLGNAGQEALDQASRLHTDGIAHKATQATKEELAQQAENLKVTIGAMTKGVKGKMQEMGAKEYAIIGGVAIATGVAAKKFYDHRQNKKAEALAAESQQVNDQAPSDLPDGYQGMKQDRKAAMDTQPNIG